MLHCFLGRYRFSPKLNGIIDSHQCVLYLFDLVPLESKEKLSNHYSEHIMFLYYNKQPKQIGWIAIVFNF